MWKIFILNPFRDKSEDFINNNRYILGKNYIFYNIMRLYDGRKLIIMHFYEDRKSDRAHGVKKNPFIAKSSGCAWMISQILNQL